MIFSYQTNAEAAINVGAPGAGFGEVSSSVATLLCEA
jgi:hypothetical protein